MVAQMTHALLGTNGQYTIIGPNRKYLCEVRSDEDTYDLYEIIPTGGVTWLGDFQSVERCLEHLEDHYAQRFAEHDEDKPEQQPFDGSELEPSARAPMLRGGRP